jgi:hypothetical protein
MPGVQKTPAPCPPPEEAAHEPDRNNQPKAHARSAFRPFCRSGSRVSHELFGLQQVATNLLGQDMPAPRFHYLGLMRNRSIT